jgi:hypothetical protein
MVLRGEAGICPLKMGGMVLMGWILSAFRTKNGIEGGEESVASIWEEIVLKSG